MPDCCRWLAKGAHTHQKGMVRRVHGPRRRSRGEPDKMKCPNCKSLNVRASDRFIFTDLIERLRGQSAYRCRNCRVRFYAATGPDSKPLASLSGLWNEGMQHSRTVALCGLALALFLGLLKLAGE